MADLTIITETGIMPHAACRCTTGGRTEWLGFKPRAHLHPISKGYVDRTDLTAFVNHSASFLVDNGRLQQGAARVAGEYEQKEYVLGVCDCVSFAADVARSAGLIMPAINMTPYGFLKFLEFYNNNRLM